MSLGEGKTITALTTSGRNSSSLSVRAHSPQRPPDIAKLPPNRTRSRTSNIGINNEGDIELDELGYFHGYSSTDAPRFAPSSSPSPGDARAPGDDGPPPTVNNTENSKKVLDYLQHTVLCWNLFLAGWDAGTTGPLLHRIQEVYHANYAVVSLLFVFTCLGFIGGAALNVHLIEHLGFGKTMVLGSLFQVVGYAVMSAAPPFPVLVLAYCMDGFGIAVQDANANAYVASYKKQAANRMGILHAVFGAGALVAPLAATQFAQIPQWSFFFLISLGIALSNTIALLLVFRLKGQDECLKEIGQMPDEHAQGDSESSRQMNKYRQIFKQKELHFLAFFTLVYVGIEVALGGWIVEYIRQERQGGPSSGYISSGFFGGLAVGRVSLLWLNKAIGEHRVMYLYIVLSIGLELVVWLVPSLIGGAVAVSIVGMLLGPMYPIIMNHAGRVLSPWLLAGSIGWIAGFGQAGSAFLPFLTGAIAQSKGIVSLQPLLISMMALLLVLWFFVPTKSRRID
ncbi:MFS general substrate transporter [Panus rudis PR-1116 ss-1]|nr:MFS general substrate transporter [Panus rudis PR-1116 ss-1]